MLFPTRQFAIAFTTLALVSQPLSPAWADDDIKREASIVVSGEGDAGVAPDMAIISISVVKMAKTAEQALSDNSGSMAAVIAALKKQGVADKDLQTSGLNIQPQYVYPENSGNGVQTLPELVGYQVTNGLTVRLYDIAKVGAIIDQSVKLGINQGAGITFSNKDPKPTLDRARRQAVTDAISKAGILAEAAGVKLGRIVEMSEVSAQPLPMDAVSRSGFKQSAEAVPVEAGETHYHVTVNMTFAIDQ